MSTCARNDERGISIALVMNICSPWSVDIAVSLASLGAKVTVLAFQSGSGRETQTLGDEGLRRLESAGITIERHSIVANAAIKLLQIAFKLLRLRNRGGVDVWLTLYGGAYAVAAWASGIRPFCVYWVGSDILLARQPLLALIRLAASKAALNLANGFDLADAGRVRLAAPDLRPLYIGIDSQHYRCEGRCFDSKDVSIICTRWFEPVYDNLTIVRAFAAVAKIIPDSRLIFVSSGSQLCDAKALWQNISERDGPMRVRFLGGVRQIEMVRELCSSDIYVSMSLSDGTSTALLEAFAAGLFPILSDIPANREWLISHGCKGVLVPIGEPEKLAQAIISAIRGVEFRRAAVLHNLEVVQKLADASTNRQILLGALQTIAREQNPLATSSIPG